MDVKIEIDTEKIANGLRMAAQIVRARRELQRRRGDPTGEPQPTAPGEPAMNFEPMYGAAAGASTQGGVINLEPTYSVNPPPQGRRTRRRDEKRLAALEHEIKEIKARQEKILSILEKLSSVAGG